MAQVLAAVPIHGLDAVLVAAERVHSSLKLYVESTANMARYDGLRQSIPPGGVLP